MSLKERIDADLKDAMRSKKELELSVLRMLKSAIKYKEVEPGASALDDGAVMAVIGSLIKQRKDSVEQYQKANRADLADKEEREIAILRTYLPEPLSPEQLKALVQKAIAESGAKSPKDMGQVMKRLLPEVQGRAEGKAVSDEVRAQLQSAS